MNRMLAIASELEDLRTQLTSLRVHISHLEADITGRKLYLIPVDGWPGKNADDRKVAQEKAYAADAILAKINAALQDAQTNALCVQADMDSLVDERRSLEWTVRMRMVDFLAGKDESSEVAPDDAAFETVVSDAMQATLDSAANDFAAMHQANSAAYAELMNQETGFIVNDDGGAAYFVGDDIPAAPEVQEFASFDNFPF